MKRILVVLLFMVWVVSSNVYAEIITHRWDGNTYVGEVKDGQLHGQGKYIGADGIKYEGQWKYSKFHGQGTLIMPDGNKFVGEFRDNNAWEAVVYRSGAIAGTFVQGQWCQGCQPKQAGASTNSLSGLLGALGAATKQAQKSNQAGGASASSLFGALQKATKQAGSTSGSQQTASLSSTTSGGSGSMADKMYEAYHKYPRGPATRYAHGKSEIQNQIDGASMLPANHPTVTYLQKVLTAVALFTHRPITYTGRYAVVVVEDETPNAFAGAGGVFYVASGMLDLLEDEDELAFLLAHELAHVELDHSFSVLSDRAYAELAAKQLGMDISSIWNDETKWARWVMREEEADKRGLELMAIAGYNPSAGIRFAKKLDSAVGETYRKGLTADTSRKSRMKKIAKNLAYRDSGGFELRKKRFEQNMGGGAQTASSSVTSDTKKKKKKEKKKSKSSVGDDK